MNVTIPAGSRALDIMRLSQYAGESEILLAPGRYRQTTLLNDDGVCDCVYENDEDNYIINELYQDVIANYRCENCRRYGRQTPAEKFCYTCSGIMNQYCTNCFDDIHSDPSFSLHICFKTTRKRRNNRFSASRITYETQGKE